MANWYTLHATVSHKMADLFVQVIEGKLWIPKLYSYQSGNQQECRIYLGEDKREIYFQCYKNTINGLKCLLKILQSNSSIHTVIFGSRTKQEEENNHELLFDFSDDGIQWIEKIYTFMTTVKKYTTFPNQKHLYFSHLNTASLLKLSFCEFTTKMVDVTVRVDLLEDDKYVFEAMTEINANRMEWNIGKWNESIFQRLIRFNPEFLFLQHLIFRFQDWVKLTRDQYEQLISTMRGLKKRSITVEFPSPNDIIRRRNRHTVLYGGGGRGFPNQRSTSGIETVSDLIHFYSQEDETLFQEKQE